MNLRELKKIKEVSEGYSMLAYKIKDQKYPSSNGNFMKVEIILEKVVIERPKIELSQADMSHLIEEAEETLPKRHLSPGSSHSIYQYLEILGVDKKDIYSQGYLRNGDRGRTEADKRARGYGKDTIYKRFELYELETMIEEARKKKIREIHPDLHVQDRAHFDEETRKVNNAYDKAMNILKWRGL